MFVTAQAFRSEQRKYDRFSGPKVRKGLTDCRGRVTSRLSQTAIQTPDCRVVTWFDGPKPVLRQIDLPRQAGQPFGESRYEII